MKDYQEHGASAVVLLEYMTQLNRLRDHAEQRIKAMADAPDELKARVEAQNREDKLGFVDQLAELQEAARIA